MDFFFTTGLSMKDKVLLLMHFFYFTKNKERCNMFYTISQRLRLKVGLSKGL